MMAANDQDRLIMLAQRGSLAAFNQLVLVHQATVYNVLFSVEGDPQRIEALTEKTFCHAYRRLASYSGGSFRAWLVRIAWNECHRGHRRARPLPAAVPGAHPTGEPDIVSTLASLPVAERWLLVLADREGFDHGEIASIAGIGVPEVARRLASARLHLGRVLNQGTCSQAGTLSS